MIPAYATIISIIAFVIYRKQRRSIVDWSLRCKPQDHGVDSQFCLLLWDASSVYKWGPADHLSNLVWTNAVA